MVKTGTKLGSYIICGLIAAAGLSLLTGCDPIARHKVLTTVFDGVPSLPPAEQICAEYADQKVTQLREELTGKKGGLAKNAEIREDSQHPPYAEKKCDSCHDKTKEGGTILPKKELCLMCHKDFFKGPFLHGPAAVGDCLACHLPHNSNHGPLLKVSKGEICGTCHRETRVASAMHDKVKAQHMVCVDCHNPHYGSSAYFLK
jgi:predicted CXXCH cytochrome family protein